MRKSPTAFNRVRPALGTLMKIQLESAAAEASDWITQAFEKTQQLEKIFSFHDPASLLSQFNLGIPLPATEQGKLLQELIGKARLVENISQGSFSLGENSKIDLGGIAKGFVVDQVVDFLRLQDELTSGFVNAGGDLRFFRQRDPEVELRLGSSERPFQKKLRLVRAAVCTSSLNVASTDPQTSTRYLSPLRAGLDEASSAVVMAEKAWIADALTKVVLFGTTAQIKACCEVFQALAFCFNSHGDLLEVFGDDIQSKI